MGHFVQKEVKTNEEKVKNQADKMQNLKSSLASLTKKKGGMTNSDLADFVYENQQKCKPGMFVNTYYADDIKNPI